MPYFYTGCKCQSTIICICLVWWLINQGIVSLTFCRLSKIISPKFTMPDITFLLRISGWNFACVLKHGFELTYKIAAWNYHNKYDFCNTQISREYLESSQNVNETIPWRPDVVTVKPIATWAACCFATIFSLILSDWFKHDVNMLSQAAALGIRYRPMAP